MQRGAGGGSGTGAAEALPGWDAAGEGGGSGGQGTGDVGEGWVSAEAWGGTAVQAGAGAGEGGVARALGPGQEAGLRASEAWGEPLNVGAGGSRPEPGQGCLFGSGEGTGAGGRTPGAAVRGASERANVDWGCWTQGAGRPGNSPGSSPDCALGLTP